MSDCPNSPVRAVQQRYTPFRTPSSMANRATSIPTPVTATSKPKRNRQPPPSISLPRAPKSQPQDDVFQASQPRAGPSAQVGSAEDSPPPHYGISFETLRQTIDYFSQEKHCVYCITSKRVHPGTCNVSPEQIGRERDFRSAFERTKSHQYCYGCAIPTKVRSSFLSPFSNSPFISSATRTSYDPVADSFTSGSGEEAAHGSELRCRW
jgi:hypothetical protein